MIDSYADKFISETDKGVCDAMNKGTFFASSILMAGSIGFQKTKIMQDLSQLGYRNELIQNYRGWCVDKLNKVSTLIFNLFDE